MFDDEDFEEFEEAISDFAQQNWELADVDCSLCGDAIEGSTKYARHMFMQNHRCDAKKVLARRVKQIAGVTK